MRELAEHGQVGAGGLGLVDRREDGGRRCRRGRRPWGRADTRRCGGGPRCQPTEAPVATDSGTLGRAPRPSPMSTTWSRRRPIRRAFGSCSNASATTVVGDLEADALEAVVAIAAASDSLGVLVAEDPVALGVLRDLDAAVPLVEDDVDSLRASHRRAFLRIAARDLLGRTDLAATTDSACPSSPPSSIDACARPRRRARARRDRHGQVRRRRAELRLRRRPDVGERAGTGHRRRGRPGGSSRSPAGASASTPRCVRRGGTGPSFGAWPATGRTGSSGPRRGSSRRC